MKRAATLVVRVVLAATISATAAGLISKAQAEKDALKAVNGVAGIQPVLDTQGRIRNWSVDIGQLTHEYEVHVDAHTGAILKVIVQPASVTNKRSLMTKPEAVREAENAGSGGSLLEARLESESGECVWSVDLSKPESETEVRMDAYSSEVLKIITQPTNSAAACHFISKRRRKPMPWPPSVAEASCWSCSKPRIILQSGPSTPPTAAVNSKPNSNACTGKIVAIVPGG